MDSNGILKSGSEEALPQREYTQRSRGNLQIPPTYAEAARLSKIPPTQWTEFWPLLGKSEIKFHVQSQKITGREADLSPLLRLRFTHAGVKEMSGDKFLLPTCDFLMFGDFLHLGASQEWSQNGQTQDPQPPVGGILRVLLLSYEKHGIRTVQRGDNPSTMEFTKPTAPWTPSCLLSCVR